MKILSDELVKSLQEALNKIPNKCNVTSKGETTYELASKLAQELAHLRNKEGKLNGDV